MLACNTHRKMISVGGAIYLETMRHEDKGVERMQQYAFHMRYNSTVGAGRIIMRRLQHSMVEVDSITNSTEGVAIFNAKSPNRNIGIGSANR